MEAGKKRKEILYKQLRSNLLRRKKVVKYKDKQGKEVVTNS